MPDVILKSCATCKQCKNINEFCAHKCRPDGLRNVCKTCLKAENRASYLRNQEKRQAEGRAKQVEWRKDPANAEKNRKAAADWYLANGDVARERSIRWVKDNPDQKRESDRNWGQQNLGRKNAYSKTYKARKRNATPAWADFEAIAQKYEEAAALSRATREPFHVDHIVPLQGKTVCGLHVHNNLAAIRGVENLSKSNRYWPDMP